MQKFWDHLVDTIDCLKRASVSVVHPIIRCMDVHVDKERTANGRCMINPLFEFTRGGVDLLHRRSGFYSWHDLGDRF